MYNTDGTWLFQDSHCSTATFFSVTVHNACTCTWKKNVYIQIFFYAISQAILLAFFSPVSMMFRHVEGGLAGNLRAQFESSGAPFPSSHQPGIGQQ